mgnify:CR=1 FL=1
MNDKEQTEQDLKEFDEMFSKTAFYAHANNFDFKKPITIGEMIDYIVNESLKRIEELSIKK